MQHAQTVFSGGQSTRQSDGDESSLDGSDHDGNSSNDDDPDPDETGEGRRMRSSRKKGADSDDAVPILRHGSGNDRDRGGGEGGAENRSSQGRSDRKSSEEDGCKRSDSQHQHPKQEQNRYHGSGGQRSIFAGSSDTVDAAVQGHRASVAADLINGDKSDAGSNNLRDAEAQSFSKPPLSTNLIAGDRSRGGHQHHPDDAHSSIENHTCGFDKNQERGGNADDTAVTNTEDDGTNETREMQGLKLAPILWDSKHAISSKKDKPTRLREDVRSKKPSVRMKKAGRKAGRSKGAIQSLDYLGLEGPSHTEVCCIVKLTLYFVER